ncbi:MAG: hypothetical protein AAFV88_20090 [Planctomycetota bacterium]
MKRLAALFGAFLFLSSFVQAFDWRVSNDREVARALDQARPGDRILFAPGRYRSFSRTGLRGITLRSENVNDRAVIDAAGGNEAMKLSSVTDMTVEQLIFENYTANGINIDDSFNWPNGKSSGVVLRGITVRNEVAVGGNRDGIKLSGVDGFHLPLLTRCRPSLD